MSIFSFLKKEKVPSELPELALDEIEKKIDDSLEEDTKVISEHLKKEEKKIDLKEELSEKKITEKKEQEIKEEVVEKELPVKMPGKSFFDDLQQHINSEIDNLDKLEDWYEKKFLPQDIVSNMRNYWENQKANSVLQILGKNFKERISEKTTGLQRLEKEWQNIYFDLIEKEEEIKDKEGELKVILSEFVELCKRKKKMVGEKDNEQKKINEKKKDKKGKKKSSR